MAKKLSLQDVISACLESDNDEFSDGDLGDLSRMKKNMLNNHALEKVILLQSLNW